MRTNRKKLARDLRRPNPTGVNPRWIVPLLLASVGPAAWSQPAEVYLPRPGLVVVTDVTGEVTAMAADQRKVVKAEERLRVGSTIMTGRRSMASLVLSNGTILRLGSEAELEIEEFGQATVSGSPKYLELKEEPTVSKTRLKLNKGSVTIEVKPLKVSRGSSFYCTLPAGTLRTSDGTFHAMVQMSDLALGVCTLELTKGSAEFELPGAAFSPVPLGSKLAFALELDRATGAIKVGEMPREAPKAT
jgi:hypothetical protein